MKHNDKWDLKTIPDELFHREWGRRTALKRVYKSKAVVCDRCGKTITARRARFRCPAHTPPADRGVVTIRRKKEAQVDPSSVGRI